MKPPNSSLHLDSIQKCNFKQPSDIGKPEYSVAISVQLQCCLGTGIECNPAYMSKIARSCVCLCKEYVLKIHTTGIYQIYIFVSSFTRFGYTVPSLDTLDHEILISADTGQQT